MDQNQPGRRGQYQGRGNDQLQPSDQGSDRDLTTASQSGRQGGWQGYVVPYRYYGPGYAGTGYYAVYYQGGAEDGGETEEGRAGPAEFDQGQGRYGRGQGGQRSWQQAGGQGGQRSWQGGQAPAQGGQRSWQGGERSVSGGGGGGFAGRGPKGYRRSDERIREEVSDRLTEHDELDASDIEVQVTEGEVTLSGSVDSREAKRLAEDIAEGCSGVRDVTNQIKVGERSGGSMEGDSSRSRQTSQARTGRSPSQAGMRSSQGGTSRSSAGGTSRSSSGTGRSSSQGGTSRSTSGSTTRSTRPRTKAGSPEESGSQTEAREPVRSSAGGPTDGGQSNGSERTSGQGGESTR